MNKPNDLKLTNVQTITPDGGRDPYYVIGDDRAQYHVGEHVAIAITVNFTLRDGERNRGHGIPLHEIPLLRRLYPGGSVVIHKEWVPGVNRGAPMTRRLFEEEIKRLARSYTIPREGGAPSKIFAEVYGETEADATRKLHEGMKKIYDAWKALEQRALADFEKAGGKIKGLPPGAIHGMLPNYMTPEDIEAIVQLVEPRTKTLETVTLASIESDSDAAPAEPADAVVLPNADIRKTLAAEFGAVGFSDRIADELATLTIEASPELEDSLLVQSSLAIEGKLDQKLVKKARKVAAAWAERQKVTT